MNTVKVIVGEEDSDVPGTGAFFTSNSGSISGLGIGLIISLAIIGALIVSGTNSIEPI